jgi:hypothetical protein
MPDEKIQDLLSLSWKNLYVDAGEDGRSQFSFAQLIHIGGLRNGIT